MVQTGTWVKHNIASRGPPFFFDLIKNNTYYNKIGDPINLYVPCNCAVQQTSTKDFGRVQVVRA